MKKTHKVNGIKFRKGKNNSRDCYDVGNRDYYNTGDPERRKRVMEKISGINYQSPAEKWRKQQNEKKIKEYQHLIHQINKAKLNNDQTTLINLKLMLQKRVYGYFEQYLKIYHKDFTPPTRPTAVDDQLIQYLLTNKSPMKHKLPKNGGYTPNFATLSLPDYTPISKLLLIILDIKKISITAVAINQILNEISKLGNDLGDLREIQDINKWNEVNIPLMCRIYFKYLVLQSKNPFPDDNNIVVEVERVLACTEGEPSEYDSD